MPPRPFGCAVSGRRRRYRTPPPARRGLPRHNKHGPPCLRPGAGCAAGGGTGTCWRARGGRCLCWAHWRRRSDCSLLGRRLRGRGLLLRHRGGWFGKLAVRESWLGTALRPAPDARGRRRRYRTPPPAGSCNASLANLGSRAECPAHVAAVSGSSAGPSEEAGPASPAAARATAALLRTAAREPCSLTSSSRSGSRSRRSSTGWSTPSSTATSRHRSGTTTGTGYWERGDVRFSAGCKGTTSHVFTQGHSARFSAGCKGTTSHVSSQRHDVRFSAGCKGTTSRFHPLQGDDVPCLAAIRAFIS